jgi:hypothetical protein
MEFTMATKKIAQRTKTTRTRSKKAASDARSKKVAARRAVAGVRRTKAQDHPKEDAETVAARTTRVNAERTILASRVPGSLASKLRQLLGQGHWNDPDAPDPQNNSCMSGSLDHAIIRAAAIQIRAIALALGHDPQGESRLSPELVLSDDETAFALTSISMMLAIGSKLADDLRTAQGSARVP